MSVFRFSLLQLTPKLPIPNYTMSMPFLIITCDICASPTFYLHVCRL